MPEAKRYPYEPGKFGIPLDELPLHPKFQTVKSGSGREIKCLLEPNNIRVIDLGYTNWMIAEVTIRGVLGFQFQTDHLQGLFRRKVEHPDFFRQAFVNWTVDFFTRQNFYDISGIYDIWDSNDPDYALYMERYLQTEDVVDALSTTRLGDLIQSSKFRVPRLRFHTGQTVEVALFEHESKISLPNLQPQS